MNNMIFHTFWTLCLFSVLATGALVGSFPSEASKAEERNIEQSRIAFSYEASPKDKAKELIAKHLKAIGSAEARKKLKSITAIGSSKAVFKERRTGIAEGIVVVASQGKRNMIGMKFNNSNYKLEAMGYDGNELSVGFARPGVRSLLGNFLRMNSKTFKIGLMGGILSTSWELYNYDERIGKLKYSGTKKINGIKLLRFNYFPRKGSDLEVRLFFDMNTYRHVRSEYTRLVSAGIGTSVDDSARRSETRYKMVERFDDFRLENGLNLPHRYNLYLEINAGFRGDSVVYEWKMNLQRFIFNQNLGADQFRVDQIRSENV